VDLPEEEEASRAEVLQEIRVLRGLEHPNIVGYFEAFTEGTTICIAMEYADGGDLAASIVRRRGAGQRFQEREAMAVFAQLTLAVQYLHEERRIMHRDLKSANVFLTSSGAVKLGDFGIAKVLRPSARCAQTRVGSPYYLPPEICESQPYDFKADVWCLGVVFYETLALEVPFVAQNIAALVVRIITAEPQPLPTMYGSDTRALATRLLSKRPNERPLIGEVAALPHVRRSIASLAAMGAAAAGAARVAFAGRRHSLQPLSRSYGSAPTGAPSWIRRSKGHSCNGLDDEEPPAASSLRTCASASTFTPAPALVVAPTQGTGRAEEGSLVECGEDFSFSVSDAVDLAEVEDLIRESPAKRPRPSIQPRVIAEVEREGAEPSCTTPPAPPLPPPVRSGWSGRSRPRTASQSFDLAELELLLGLRRAQDPPIVSPPSLQQAATGTPTAGVVPAVEPPAKAAAAEAPASGKGRKGVSSARAALVAAAPTPMRHRLPQMRRSLEADFGKA